MRKLFAIFVIAAASQCDAALPCDYNAREKQLAVKLAALKPGATYEHIRRRLGKPYYKGLSDNGGAMDMTIADFNVVAREGRCASWAMVEVVLDRNERVQSNTITSRGRISFISEAEYRRLRVGMARNTVISILGEPPPPEHGPDGKTAIQYTIDDGPQHMKGARVLLTFGTDGLLSDIAISSR